MRHEARSVPVRNVIVLQSATIFCLFSRQINVDTACHQVAPPLFFSHNQLSILLEHIELYVFPGRLDALPSQKHPRRVRLTRAHRRKQAWHNESQSKQSRARRKKERKRTGVKPLGDQIRMDYSSCLASAASSPRTRPFLHHSGSSSARSCPRIVQRSSRRPCRPDPGGGSGRSS